MFIVVATLLAIGFESPAIGKSNADPRLQQFADIYEPSGVQQLPDGRILVIEDENLNPFSVLTIGDGGEVSTRPLGSRSLLDMALGTPGLPNLRDLEGIDVDDRGYIYAITSHSRTAEGKRAHARERLIRFRLDGDDIVDLQEIKKLRRAIARQHQILKDAVAVADVKDDNGFNIEGLAFDRTKRQLLIAFRSPVVGKKGIIVVLENPDAAFENGKKPKISDKLISLELARGGIRAITFDSTLDGYLIASRREDKKDKKFKLWFWGGDTGQAPHRIKVFDKIKIENAEGITPVRVDGKEHLLIVFDDGNRIARKGAHYLILDYKDLDLNLR